MEEAPPRTSTVTTGELNSLANGPANGDAAAAPSANFAANGNPPVAATAEALPDRAPTIDITMEKKKKKKRRNPGAQRSKVCHLPPPPS